MKTNYVGLAMVAPHIKAYWLKRHGVEKPLNNDPKNAFLGRFLVQITEMIEFVNQVQAEGDPKQDLADIRLHIYESLKMLDGELHEAKSQHFGNKDFCDLIHVLQDDVEGARQHLKPLLGTNKEEQEFINYIGFYSESLGGTVLDNVNQGFTPFYGSERNEEDQLTLNTGVCYGKVVSWANGQPYNIEDILKIQTQNRDWTLSKSRSVAILELNRLFKPDYTISSESYFTILILYSTNKSNSHAIGIQQCDGSSEYEVCDPNYGTYKFENKINAVRFLNFLAIEYYINNRCQYEMAITHKELILNKNKQPIKRTSAPPRLQQTDELTKIILGRTKALANSAAKRDFDQDAHSENKLIRELLILLEKDPKMIKCSQLIQTLVQSEYYRIVELVCIAAELNNEAILDIMNDKNNNRKSLNENSLLTTAFIKLYPDCNNNDINKFDKLPNDLYKMALLETMMRQKIDINMLFDIYVKFKNHPAVLYGIANPGLSQALLDALIKYDLTQITRISTLLYGSEELPGDKNSLSIIYANAKFMNQHPEDPHFADPEFLKCVSDALVNTRITTPDETRYQIARLIFNGKHAEKLLAGHEQATDKVASLMTRCENIIQNPECTEPQREAWGFVKQYAEIIHNNNPATIHAFIKNEQMMKNFIKHFTHCMKLTHLQPIPQIIDAVYEHLVSSLSDTLHCQYLQQLYQTISHYPVDAEALCNGLTPKNQVYLIPILTKKESLTKMSIEQFKKLLDKMSVDTINDAILSQDVIPHLSLQKVIFLVKYLTTKNEEGIVPAQAFQFEEQAGIAEKCKEHSAFKRALTHLVSDMAPNKTRWVQIVDHLRFRADDLLREDTNGRLASSIGKDMSYINDLANKEIINRFAQPKNQASSSRHPK